MPALWTQAGSEEKETELLPAQGEHGETSGASYLSAFSHVYRVGTCEPDMNLGSLAI